MEYQDVPWKFFCLTLPKTSVGETSIVALTSGTGKICKRRGQISRLSVEKFLSHSAENFCRGILYCCNNFGYRKILESRGVSIFSVESFLCHTAENFPREILYCCINFGYRKSLKKRGGGGVSRFTVEIFLSHSAEKFRRRTL